MQELIALLVEKACLNEQDANTAATTTLDYLKTKMPTVMHSTLAKAFDGHDVQDALKDQAQEMLGDAKEKLEDLAGDLKDKIGGLFGGNKA